MKKILIILTVILSGIATKSIAQEKGTDYREEVMFGAKVGLNYSNVYDAEGENFNADSKFGLATGVFLALPLSKLIGLQPEILYSQKGFQATGSILGGAYDFTRTTSFIDVPLLFAIKPISALTILAGPQYSYLIKQKDVFANGVTTIEQEKEFANDNIRKNLLCFTIGADINVEHLVIGARAGWDIQKNNGDGTSTTPRYKNVWYQATIGYRFY
jgi:hypothetical protein